MRVAQRIAGSSPSVFSEFSALARAHGAVNLGQGFPDTDGPEALKEAAARALREGPNQYAISSGVPALRRAVAEHAARFYGQVVDPDSMVTVTAGATEGLMDAVLALVDPGDEVVLFQPFYDSYAMAVRMAGGVARIVTLRPPDAEHAAWWFEDDELRAAFGPRTRLVIVNTPHNPTGKVFTESELARVGELARARDAIVISDEVYEHLVYAPARHVRLATLPGMAERTITLSSGGKTFSLTGWKVGWVIAAPPLRDAVQRTHEHVVFATSGALQEAIAVGLALPDAFFAGLAATYRARRDALSAALADGGLRPLPTEGTFFIIADTSRLGFDDDFACCRHLTTGVGVAAIPPSPFYRPEDRALARHLARFAFCKVDATLAEAAARLRRYQSTAT